MIRARKRCGSANPVGGTHEQFVVENRTCGQKGEEQRHQRQGDRGLEALRVERHAGEKTAAQKIIDALHHDRSREQHHLRHAEADLQQAAAVEKDRHERQRGGERQQDAQIEGGSVPLGS